MNNRAPLYLDTCDGWNLLLQEMHSGPKLLANEVATAAGLQLGNQVFIGQPELFTIVCCCDGRDGALDFG